MTTTTNRELLELAAKAAGYQIDARASFKTWRDSRRLALLNPQGGHTLWNAEEDDGDAFRLAVKLNMRLDLFTGVSAQAEGVALCVQADYQDKAAATRRAIVRAAAAIAKSQERTHESNN